MLEIFGCVVAEGINTFNLTLTITIYTYAMHRATWRPGEWTRPDIIATVALQKIKGKKRKKKECMTRTSRVVPHHSTNLARCRLTSMCGMGIGAIGMKCTHS